MSHYHRLLKILRSFLIKNGIKRTYLKTNIAVSWVQSFIINVFILCLFAKCVLKKICDGSWLLITTLGTYIVKLRMGIAPSACILNQRCRRGDIRLSQLYRRQIICHSLLIDLEDGWHGWWLAGIWHFILCNVISFK